MDRDSDQICTRNKQKENVHFAPSTSEELFEFAKTIVNDKYVCKLVDTGIFAVLTKKFK